MTKYIVESSIKEKFEKNYMILLINAIPAIVWSIPFHQKLFPEITGVKVLGICILFIAFYVIVGMIPFVAIAPDIASVIMAVAMVWSLVDIIGNNLVRIVIKILVAVFFGMVGFTLFVNATLPWLQSKSSSKPIIRKIEDD